MITVVSSSVCPYCTMAKELITSLWFEYEEVLVEFWSDELNEIIQKTWMMTVPQVFAWKISKENLLGWYTDILDLQNEDKLVEILKKAS